MVGRQQGQCAGLYMHALRTLLLRLQSSFVSIMADEANFITILIASERVGQWLDTLRAHRAGGASLPRAKNALKELVAALQTEAYAEEVCTPCGRHALVAHPLGRQTILQLLGLSCRLAPKARCHC